MAEDLLFELLNLVDSDTPPTDNVTNILNEIADAVCMSGPETRDNLISSDAYTAVCRAWIFCCYSGVPNENAPAPGAQNCLDAVLRALYALTPGHPDIIDDVGWQIVSQAIDKNVPEKTHLLVIKLLRNIFIKCEANRDHFTWNMNMIPQLIHLIFKPKISPSYLAEWCSTLKALILTDDVGAAYNKSADRKRAIARAKVLPVIAGRLNDREFETDERTLNAIVILLGSMAVTDDLCEQIEGGNVLQGIRGIYINHPSNKALIRNTTTLLRHLCSCQSIRDKSANFALMKYVVETIIRYKKNADVVNAAMACCAYMTVRSACQVAQFMTKGGLPLTMEIMTEYKEKISIMKFACFTLRNIAENGGQEAKDKLKEGGFGILLNHLKNTHLELKEFYVIPVLKELEADPDKVVLHEEFSSPFSDVSPAGNFDNVPVEPRAGRKSIVLDESDED